MEAATALYNKFSTVSDDFLKMRDIVLARKIPRRLFVQPHTMLLGENNHSKVLSKMRLSNCLSCINYDCGFK